MKYKVNDNVRVKSKVWFDAQKKDKDGDIDLGGRLVFDSDMAEFLGLEANVTKVYNDTYRLDIDNEEWSWADWMLEDPIPKHTIQRRKFSPVGPIIY